MKLSVGVVVASIIGHTFGFLDFSTENVYPIDTCIVNGASSTIYRCSDESVWQYTYVGSSSCSGVANVNSLMGGCDSNFIYHVDNCTEAQTAAKTGSCKYYASGLNTNLQAYALDVCFNTDTSSSSMYRCANGVAYQYFYTEVDCTGVESNNSVNGSSVSFNCNGNDCHAKVRQYDKTSGSSEYCNYDTSNYLPPGTGDCNYFTFSNGDAPRATGKCFSTRIGNYKYSGKYECYRPNTNSEYQIIEYRWLDNDNCAGDSSKYIINNYTSANYTIHCGKSDCGKSVRTYSSCVASLDTFRQSYTEYPVVLDQCLQYWTDTSNKFNHTASYYMYACIDGYLGVYYYADSECSEINTFTVSNTSANTCPTIIESCTKSFGLPMFNLQFYNLLFSFFFFYLFF